MSFCGLQDRTSLLYKDTTTSKDLGPGTYNYNPGQFDELSKRVHSKKPPAFMP